MSSSYFSEESDYNDCSDYDTMSSKSVCTDSIADFMNTTCTNDYTSEYYDTTCESTNDIQYKLPTIIKLNNVTTTNDKPLMQAQKKIISYDQTQDNKATIVDNKDTDISEAYNDANNKRDDKMAFVNSFMTSNNVSCCLVNNKYYLLLNDKAKHSNVNGNTIYELSAGDINSLKDVMDMMNKPIKRKPKIDENKYFIDGDKLIYRYVYGKRQIKRNADLKTLGYKTFASLPKSILNDCLKWYSENNDGEYDEKINIIKALLA